ncbi:LEM domain-containing inner nuclear membrane protein MAN1 [Cotesia typhae]|uniref:LEM domain-containing inner nuclear membrane protein MAN1 n=1 Tax=Cotesia typhae TaxID=2053667 RepID=UPI003D683FBC
MSVESLTDSELRSKLAEYGYPVGPVTQTTRKILVKKLKNLIESRGASGSRHSLAARYSSDDTDEDTASSTTRKKKPATNRRQTMANPMPPPAPAPPVSTSIPSRSPSKRRAGSRTSETKEIVVPDYEEPTSNSSSRVMKSVTKKITKSYKLSTVNDGLETGSDSDIPEEPEKSSKLQNEKSYSTTRKDRSSVDVEKPSTKSFGEARPSKSYESKTYESVPKVSLSREEKYSVPLFKPNISPIAPVKEDNYKRDDTNVNDLLANYESPFLSEFTRRLSSQTKTNVLPSRSNFKSTGLKSTRSDSKDSDTNGHFLSTKSSYNSRYVSSSNDRPREVVTRSYKAPISKEDSRNSQNMVSMILVIVLALFFSGLAVVYLGLGGKSETIPTLPMDNEVPLCKSDHDKPGVNCILEENVETVMQLLKTLRPKLMERAVAAACENSLQSAYLTDLDIINMYKSQKVKELEITSDLHDAQLLVFENPKWGISLIEIEGGKNPRESVFDSMENVFQSRLDDKVAMVMLNPELPMMCMIKQKIMSILSTLLFMIAGIGLIFGGHLCVQLYLKYKKSTEREVFQLVSEIISMVELHHQNAMITNPGGTQESFLAINHVRDNLIPPKDRKKMAGLWEKAVKFLDENESRIRREVQQVAGEEFHVWRWLPNINSSPPTTPVASKKTKVWQGQAFETMEGSVNSLTCSPTPCLKIRHMFDPDVEFEEDWEIKVQDAILEKCGEGVKILHIRVDRGSREGCVYMKCFSQEDAGKAYRALHGCWFDGHLVTVKYLRLERYHERFPGAVRCNIPLKPSNNQRLSMQAHYWQSPLEAN